MVEIEQVLVDWHATHLRDRTGAALADPRVQVVVADVRDHLAASPAALRRRSAWTSTTARTGRSPTTTPACTATAGSPSASSALAPAACSRSGAPHPPRRYEQLLRQQLDDVRVVEIPAYVERGAPDVVYLGRRPARA